MLTTRCCDKAKVAFTTASLLLVALISFTLMALIIVITASESDPSLMITGILGSVAVGVAGFITSAVTLVALVGTVMYCANPSATHNCITKLLVIFGISIFALTIPGAVFGILMYCFYVSTPALRFAVPCLVIGVVLCIMFAFWIISVILTCVCMEVKQQQQQYGDVVSEDEEEEMDEDLGCPIFCCCRKENDVFSET